MTVTAITPTAAADGGGRNGDRGQFCCDRCGGRFEPSRSDARYCSNACRQKAYRLRQAEAGGQVRLTAESRETLRRAIDRRRRELLAARDAADRELFADDGEAA
jgi:hypothetical protein